MKRMALGAAVSLVAAPLGLLACTKSESPPEASDDVELRETGDPFNLIYEARIKSGRVVRLDRKEVPKEAFSWGDMRKPEKVEEEPPRPPGRVHPMVERWLAKRSLNETRNPRRQLPRERPNPAVSRAGSR